MNVKNKEIRNYCVKRHKEILLLIKFLDTAKVKFPRMRRAQWSK